MHEDLINITIEKRDETRIAIVDCEEVIINSAIDALDLMVTVMHVHDCQKMIVYKDNLAEDFFDLKTGIAGEILQRFSNYNMQLAIVGDFSNYKSQSLNDFIFESNKGRQIYFAQTMLEALDRLHGI